MIRHINGKKVNLVEAGVVTNYDYDYEISKKKYIIKFCATFDKFSIDDLTKEEYRQALIFIEGSSSDKLVEKEIKELEAEIAEKEKEGGEEYDS